MKKMHYSLVCNYRVNGGFPKTAKLKARAAVALLACVVLYGCASSSSLLSVGERTAALGGDAWSVARWLSASDADGVQCGTWFFGSYTNEQRVVSAKWMTTALGTFDLFVNGRPVGDEVLRPGFTHPLKTRRTFTYDITRAFHCRAGAGNVLAVQVAPGWWADKVVSQGSEMMGKKCAFRGVLQLTYDDGTIRRYGTSPDTWRTTTKGPLRQAGIFEGERYDARLALSLDEEPSALAVPVVNDEFKGQLLPSEGAEVFMRHDLALKPVKAYVWKEVEGASDQAFGKVVVLREYTKGQTIALKPGETLVVDFGQNAAAVPSFVFSAAEGTTLTCLPGELLNDGNGAHSRGMDGPEGSVHRQNLRSGDRQMQLHYTFGANNGYVAYTPSHTFFGYRFVSITTTADVTIRDILSIPVTSIAQSLETGTIITGNADINRLISNTLWGMRSNYLSVPTDCPQRDERQGWTADTQVFTETGTFFANTRAFFHKWMRDMRDTQSAEGGFPGVAPEGEYGNAGMMRLGWADAGVIVPWTVWKQFGDIAIVNENWDAMDRFFKHITDTRYDHVTLSGENGNYQWADWLSYEPLESCGGGAFEGGKPKPDAIEYWRFLSASYWAIDAEMMADMAAATGRDEGYYRGIATQAREYISSRFLNDDGTFRTAILNTMQTPALFVLRNELVRGQAKEAVIARLRENFAQHGNCLQTGFLGTSILMPTLTANGMSDIAYELLFQRRNPSWLYSIDQGATTIWERWNSYMADKGMGPRGMNSFNHYAYGCVCQWLWETAAGIAADPAKPGFTHIIMRPIPDRRLGHLSAEYHSAAGLIKSAWKYNGNRWTWKFTVPKGATATVTLPGESQTRDYESGTYSVTVDL